MTLSSEGVSHKFDTNLILDYDRHASNVDLQNDSMGIFQKINLLSTSILHSVSLLTSSKTIYVLASPGLHSEK